MTNAKDLHPLQPIIYVIAGFLVVYTLYVVSLFRPRKNGRRRLWRGVDWVWVPLAGVAGVMLLALWWRMRQIP
jgi:amino acid transporter